MPAGPLAQPDDENPLALLIYTSGSTGAPKGAMYPRRNVGKMWRRSSRNWFGETVASITLNFMPMSHVMGRGILFGTLGNGGTAYFAARSDLSTLLEQLGFTRAVTISSTTATAITLHNTSAAAVDLSGYVLQKNGVGAGYTLPPGTTVGAGADLVIGSAASGLSFSGDDFLTKYQGQPALNLYNMIQKLMPATAPGSLTRPQAADLLSYILSFNKFPAGTKEFPTDEDSLKKLTLPKPAPKS